MTAITVTTTWMDKDGNIHAVKGDSFDLMLYDIVDSNGATINFNGWTALFQARVFPNDETVVLEMDETDGIDLSIPGVIRITKDAEEMILSAKEYYYDLQMTEPEGHTATWFNKKKILMEGDVAR